MPIIGSLFQEYTETTGQDPFTHQNKKMLKVQGVQLKTQNGTTTAEYSEQSHALLLSVAAELPEMHREQREMSRQLENHIVDKAIHARGVA